MLITLKVFLKVPCSIVLKVVLGVKNGPLSDSRVRFGKGVTL